MTIASLLLALLTATSAPSGRRGALPSCSTSTPNGAALASKMRPAVDQLIRKGYPVKSIDIDKEAQLRQRYRVDRVPTFIVVDARGREIDRTSGLQSAAELARFYMAARAKAQPPANSNAHAGADDEARRGRDPDDRMSPPEPGRDRQNVPAIAMRCGDPAGRGRAGRDLGQSPPVGDRGPDQGHRSHHSTGFGSGTIIHSSPEESLILTCAHIFKLDGREQAPPSRFPRRSSSTCSTARCTSTNRRRRSTMSNRSKGGRSTTTSCGTSG